MPQAPHTAASASLLPPNATTAERAIEGAMARLGDVFVPLRDLWRADSCPAGVLPWFGWGLSIDLWDPAWTEAQKRAAIATAIDDQRRKGTPASVRAVVDRFDPTIRIVEWFAADPPLDPHRVRIELPLAAESIVTYSDALVTALMTDIAAVKPLRVHLDVAHKLTARADAYMLSAGTLTGFWRADALAGADQVDWSNTLLTQIGEPISGQDRSFLEHS